ncbi:hypothetical protein [Pseudorhodobacter sp.]|uniref:hypothetical protein n=1 Tax=Pseudorhodobacter sp. TaxID=1934400 RepID=UPI0026493FE6|nr:hypothetical protein [Pseudorhodobacter sp.]MDN5788371.1 hypothetical protein [Pseudorhodobacter sp.]
MIRGLCALIIVFALCGPAVAEVRLGKNVRIGGHDASNQTFSRKKRGEYYIYDKTPRNEGCIWRKNKDGSKTKVCHLKKKK